VAAVDSPKQERRRQIMDAAKHVFAEAGFHGTLISVIIERAKIARGTFYLHFDSKGAVFDAILDQAMADLRARIRRIEVEPGAPPPQLQLHKQVVTTLDYIIRDRPLAVMLLAAAHTPDAEAAERLDQFYSEVRGMITRALETGIELGLVRPCRAELVAAALLGMVRGVIELVVARKDLPPIEELVGELLTVALRGVLA
jgi:AcrR family transcriptional regulator